MPDANPEIWNQVGAQVGSLLVVLLGAGAVAVKKLISSVDKPNEAVIPVAAAPAVNAEIDRLLQENSDLKQRQQVAELRDEFWDEVRKVRADFAIIVESNRVMVTQQFEQIKDALGALATDVARIEGALEGRQQPRR